MTGRLRVAIAGAGIGGLCAGLILARRGHAVDIYERAPVLREVGAGIQIAPNGAAVLSRLGLDADLDAISIRASHVAPHDGRSGRAIARFALGQGAHPYRFFHRADLVALLRERGETAGLRLRAGREVISAAPEGRLVTAQGDETADLVIGADGLRSVVRPGVAGPDAPFFTGQVAWRAVLEGVEAPPEARIWMLPGRHVVTYPLPGRRLNLVAVREQSDWAPEGWDHPDDPDNLRAAFADAAPELAGWLAQLRQIRLWGLFRHEIPPRWHHGRVALLGDAAHPTLPFLAQGANLAIEEGWVLADALDAKADLGDALALYTARRLPRVRRAIDAAQANARNFHLEGIARRVAHLGLGAIGRVAPERFTARMAWLHEHDVTRDAPAEPKPGGRSR